METKELTYQEKLKDPRWQKKRLLIFTRDNWTCQSCGSSEKTLHIHHLKYLPNAEPWEYEDCYLITYCDTCHETEHLIGEQIRDILIELIDANKIFIKPLAQINNLIENYPAFYPSLKTFLNNCTIEYLKSRAA
jgi:hypothetical protein